MRVGRRRLGGANLISLLAIAEMGGQSAQNTSVITNIEASNPWGFFHVKSIRMTIMR